jgi:hypothetical protein
MQITFNTPANLVGQQAQYVFDPSLAQGSTRGAGPSGSLGATISLHSSFLRQAIDWGFSIASITYG